MTHVQGPVPVANESYVERPFEQTVQRELMNDQWVLLENEKLSSRFVFVGASAKMR